MCVERESAVCVDLLSVCVFAVENLLCVCRSVMYIGFGGVWRHEYI